MFSSGCLLDTKDKRFDARRNVIERQKNIAIVIFRKNGSGLMAQTLQTGSNDVDLFGH